MNQNQQQSDLAIINAVEELEKNLETAKKQYDHELKKIKEQAIKDFTDQENAIEQKQMADIEKEIEETKE